LFPVLIAGLGGRDRLWGYGLKSYFCGLVVGARR